VAAEQALRINQFTPELRVVNNIECPLQLYCWNKLVVLYSYDNKSCIHVKHIVIINMFCVVKRRRISKIKSYVLSKNVLVDPLTKR
jgi:hypothetical protein